MAQEATLTTGPASKRVGVTENTLRRWAHDGKVPHIKTPSGRLLFRVSDLETVYKFHPVVTDDAA